MKLKAFFIIYQGLSLNQRKQPLEDESLTLRLLNIIITHIILEKSHFFGLF